MPLIYVSTGVFLEEVTEAAIVSASQVRLVVRLACGSLHQFAVPRSELDRHRETICRDRAALAEVIWPEPR